MVGAVIDLGQRVEQRYIVPSISDFCSSISGLVERKKFSDNEFVQTIYLNNEEHMVPFSTSLKVRKYFPSASVPILTSADDYLLEFKHGIRFKKTKTRHKGTLAELVNLANDRSNLVVPLRPYFVSAYRREHYALPDSDALRITVDFDLEYFFFEKGETTAVKTGSEGYARIEVKTRDGASAEPVKQILAEMNAFPIVSKKATANYFLGQYLAKTRGGKLYKELKDCEIESKLTSSSVDILWPIRQLFRESKPDGFELSKYPYIHENASINRYYRNITGLLKILLKGNRARVVEKGATTHVGKEHGLDCILKRSEVKHTIPLWSPEVPTEVAGQLHRARKSFWVGNKETRRMYHISLDVCQSVGLEPLCQLELESVGREFKSPEPDEDAIIEDLARLTKILVANFPELTPTALTKPQWLGL